MDLDKAFPNNKVLVVHISMHWGVLNSKALEWAGIDEKTKTPEGGDCSKNTRHKRTGRTGYGNGLYACI